MHSPDSAVENQRVGFAAHDSGTSEIHSSSAAATSKRPCSGDLKRRRSPEVGKEEKFRLNVNSNNNSKRHLHSPTYSTRVKTPRLSSDYPQHEGASGASNQPKTEKTQGRFDLSLLDVANWQRQAMQLAFLHQHHASALKQHENQSSASPSSPEEESSSSAVNKSAMAMAMAAGVLPSHTGLLPQQMQQLLTQQVLSPQQLQSFMQQQQAMTAHQQVQIQEFYRQQQKQLQDFQIQLAAAKQQQKQAANTSRNDELGETLGGKMNKDQQQMQQQLALQQLMHLQQIQQQQQQQQQQQAAAAALQQQGLAAAVAMAQSRQQPQIGQELSPAELQNILLKHVAENASSSRKDSTSHQPSNSGSEKGFFSSKGRERTDERRESVNGEVADNDRRISMTRGSRESTPESRTQASTQPLFAHGVCKWPGCDVECSDVSAFSRHLNGCHRLDDKSTAQCRVQMQVVEQLEKQASQERERLEAMMAHLHMDGKDGRTESRDSGAVELYGPVGGKSDSIKSNGISANSQMNNNVASSNQHSMALAFPTPNAPAAAAAAASMSMSSRGHNPLSLPSSPISNQHISGFPTSLFPTTSSVPSSPPLFASSMTNQAMSNGPRDTMLHPNKRRHSAGVPISADLSQNQEFYRNADVRPPFTYASLIRQAIIEAPDHQMTLNEIYNWFQKKFAYFRRNAPTWKNAVRHNLSLHKCFVRVENVKGAVWTVDESEYQKRRPQKFSGSPAIRGRMDVNSNQGFYGGPMNLAAMQMTFGDAAQLASQAMFGSNPMSNYSNFMQSGFGSGISHSLSSDASMTMDPSEAVNNLTSLMGARRQSISPATSNHSFKEETHGRETYVNSNQGNVKIELLDEQPQQQSHDHRHIQKSPMYIGKPNGSPQVDEAKMFSSPGARGSRDDDNEERGSGGSTLSDASAGEDVDKPLNLHHGDHQSNESNGSLTRPSILSARGSFTMLHDQSAAE
uniref:FoxP n=1 Tax=Phallusia mammillata TaxID=59560 RepID=A0A6F9DDQ9_9ASCI|nr:FoxP [Phallusia mammillata]